MTQGAIAVGDRIHIITRRLFAEDLRRHFAGEVTAIAGDLAEVRGYAFVFNAGTNEYRKRPELRTRLFSLGHAGYIVTKMPRDVSLEDLQYRTVDKRLVVTDGREFTLDINEFGAWN